MRQKRVENLLATPPTCTWKEILRRDGHSPSHVRWYGKYPMVLVPMYRRHVLSGPLRRRLGRSIRELCQQQRVEVVAGHTMPAHMPVCLSSPPTDSVANTVGWRKGKAAIRMHRAFVGRERHCTGLHCWARGSGVSPRGLDEHVMRAYIRTQEQEEKRQEALQLKGLKPLSEEA